MLWENKPNEDNEKGQVCHLIERVFKKGLSGKVAFECGLKGVMSLVEHSR